MYKSIIKFLYSLNPELVVQAPSRINLINPLDAVEGDFWMPSVAINGINNPLAAFFYIKKISEPSRIKIYKINRGLENYYFEIEHEEALTKEIIGISKKFKGKSRLIYACIYRLSKTYSIFLDKFFSQNIEIGIFSTIPRQSGLGGSTAIIISIIYGLAQYLNLYNNLSCLKETELPLNKDIIAEIGTKVEDEDLEITAGYSDRYVISRGGVCFCSYVGKLYHKKILEEPLAIYDRIDKVYEIHELPIIVCFSGVLHESGGVHHRLREAYLKKVPKILNNYKRLAEISWKSRFALMKHNWKLLGVYFRENTRILNEIMNDVGFKYGIGLANNLLIELIKDHPDVYASKLTGAGGGGSVFALVNPDKINSVLRYWQNALNDIIKNEKVFKSKFSYYSSEIRLQLNNAEFFRIKINKRGVSIIETDDLIKKL